MYSFWAWYSLEDVVLDRAREATPVDPGLLADSHVLGQSDNGGTVDGHRRGHRAQVDAGEQVLHVGQRVDGHTSPPHLAYRPHFVVGVSPHQGRHVERGGQARSAVAQDVLEPSVGVDRGAEAGEHAHGPQPAAVHLGIDAPGVGELAGHRLVAVHRIHGDARHRGERPTAGRPAPADRGSRRSESGLPRSAGQVSNGGSRSFLAVRYPLSGCRTGLAICVCTLLRD